MGGGEKHHHHHHHLLSFHLPHLGKEEVAGSGGGEMPPKGCMAIRVGGEGEEQQRFVVPLMYLNHPLFVRLLEEAEEEYGFEHKGAITIPCHVDYFRQIQGIIDRETVVSNAVHHHDHHTHPHNHNHHLLAACFRA